MDLITTIMNLYEKTDYNTKEKYVNCFKLPIEYLDNSCVYLLNNNIVNDLELKKNKLAITNDGSNSEEVVEENSSNNLYYHVFDPKNIFEKNIINRWSNYYTNNEDFLFESQELLKNYKPIKKVEFIKDLSNESCKDDAIYNKCESVIYDNGFIHNYQYIQC